MKPENLYTLASFEFVSDVQALRGRLEAEGITVILKDENTVSIDPFASNALGGVKLQVPMDQKERAQEIYDLVRPYALTDAGEPVTCPNCKAQRSEAYYSRKGLLYKLFPFLEKRRYRCLNCQMITNG